MELIIEFSKNLGAILVLMGILLTSVYLLARIMFSYWAWVENLDIPDWLQLILIWVLPISVASAIFLTIGS